MLAPCKAGRPHRTPALSASAAVLALTRHVTTQEAKRTERRARNALCLVRWCLRLRLRARGAGWNCRMHGHGEPIRCPCTRATTTAEACCWGMGGWTKAAQLLSRYGNGARSTASSETRTRAQQQGGPVPFPSYARRDLAFAEPRLGRAAAVENRPGAGRATACL